MTPIKSITRQATRGSDEPFNVLCLPTHERFESGLALTNANFYAYRTLDDSVKDWNTSFARLPDNYTLLDPKLGDAQLPSWVDFDLVLSQNKFGQFSIAKRLSQQLRLPLISLEHTLPVPEWPQSHLDHFKSQRGNMNIFITEFSRKAWQWGEHEADVIHHGVDTNFFSPSDLPREKHILSVVNDWINRDWCCNFSLWRQVTQGLPVHPVGDTPGLSLPKGGQELADEYASSQIFINTSSVSPIPTSLLEAMSSGCACVSSATCMIPEIIQNGYNGYITNDPREMRRYLEMLLNDPKECIRLGQNARKTIQKRFSMENFVSKWNQVFKIASNINPVKAA